MLVLSERPEQNFSDVYDYHPAKKQAHGRNKWAWKPCVRCQEEEVEDVDVFS